MYTPTRVLIAAMLANAIECYSLQRAGQRRFIESYPASGGLDRMRWLGAVDKLLTACAGVSARLRVRQHELTPETDRDITHLWTRYVRLRLELREGGAEMLRVLRAHADAHPQVPAARRLITTFQSIQATLSRLDPWAREMPKHPTVRTLRKLSQSLIAMEGCRMQRLASILAARTAEPAP